MQHYHNTTDSNGADLASYERQAVNQDDVILEFFTRRPDAIAAPSELHSFLLPDAPLTSVRRALTNLTKAGKLEKTDMQKPGPFGRPEYLWRLPVKYQAQLDLFS